MADQTLAESFVDCLFLEDRFFDIIEGGGLECLLQTQDAGVEVGEVVASDHIICYRRGSFLETG